MPKEGLDNNGLLELYQEFDRTKSKTILWITPTLTVGLANALALGLSVFNSDYAQYYLLSNSVSNTILAESGLTGLSVFAGTWGGMRHEIRVSNIALKIAALEGRIPNETNVDRIVWTSALSTTLINGILVRPRSPLNPWPGIRQIFSSPIWESGLEYAQAGQKVRATLESFDRGVRISPFKEKVKGEVAFAALRLGRAKWEALAIDPNSNSRLQGYAHLMIPELTNRLDH